MCISLKIPNKEWRTLSNKFITSLLVQIQPRPPTHIFNAQNSYANSAEDAWESVLLNFKIFHIMEIFKIFYSLKIYKCQNYCKSVSYHQELTAIFSQGRMYLFLNLKKKKQNKTGHM